MSRERRKLAAVFVASRIVSSRGRADSVASVFAFASLVSFVLTQVLFRFGGVAELFGDDVTLDPCAVGEAVSFACALVSLALRREHVSTCGLAFIAASISLLLYSALQTGIFYLVHGYVILMALVYEDLDRIFRAYLLALLASFTLVVLLAIVGAIPNYDFIPNGRLVFSFGFNHPNTCAALLFNVAAASVCVLWDGRGWVFSLVLALFSAFFSYWTLSANAATVLNVLLALSCAIGHACPCLSENPLPRGPFRTTLIVIPALLLVAMMLCCARYDSANPLFSLLNNLTHARPYFAHSYFMRNCGFSLLGREYVTTSFYHSGLPFKNLDSGYCFLLLVHGLLVTAVLAVTYIAAVIRLPECERRFSVWVVIILSMTYLVVESFGLNLVSCFPLLIMSRVFARSD